MAAKRILFLHGFFSSGSCPQAEALREGLDGIAEVLSPDLSIHPKEAMETIRRFVDEKKTDLIVGNSCGSFYAQMLSPVVGVPALLGNPHFSMTDFLGIRMGEHEFKFPRMDGCRKFLIDEDLVDEFVSLEKTQFDSCSPYYKDRIWGLFGEEDPVAHCEGEFLEHYSRSFHFPGKHTPSREEVLRYYVPLAKRMLEEYPISPERLFRHFKGGGYRFVRTAFDSETEERVVIYQALYGEGRYWVRPEKMFFENIVRDGKRFPRFMEVDNIDT